MRRGIILFLKPVFSNVGAVVVVYNSESQPLRTPLSLSYDSYVS